MALLAALLQDVFGILTGRIHATPAEIEATRRWVLGNHGRFTFAFTAEACGFNVEAARDLYLEAYRRRPRRRARQKQAT